MNKKNPLVIYWAPNDSSDWDMLYPEPNFLLDNFILDKNIKSKKNTFFACPAVREKLGKTLEFRCPINSKYLYDFSNSDNGFYPENNTELFIGYKITKPASLNNKPLIEFNLSYFLFSEESLQANFTSPYFSKPQYMTNGITVPGSFDIGQWFRPYNLEIMLWENVGNFEFKEDEPLFYVEFLTDRPIVLKRFVTTAKLMDYATACSTSPFKIERNVPLISRYKRFKSARMNDLVLNEIKKNLID
jgi:hypothetical protein